MNRRTLLKHLALSPALLLFYHRPPSKNAIRQFRVVELERDKRGGIPYRLYIDGKLIFTAYGGSVYDFVAAIISDNDNYRETSIIGRKSDLITGVEFREQKAATVMFDAGYL